MKFFHIQILCLFTTLFSCQSEDIDSELKFNEASATPVKNIRPSFWNWSHLLAKKVLDVWR